MFKKLLSEGLTAHQAGDLAKAGELYRKALALQPNNPDALNLMGVLMTQAGQFDVAINLLESAAKLAPDFAPVHVNLGNAYQAAGNLDDAILAFTAAKQADISVTEAHLNLASALIAANRADEALESLDIVIKLAPNATEGYNFKGNALAELGRLIEAAQNYELAVSKQDTFFEGWVNLGGIRLKLGDLNGAISALDSALDLNVTHVQTLSTWVEAMIQNGRAGEAESRIIQAITQQPKVAALHHILGVARKMCGQFDAAIGPIEGALKLDPVNADYHLALGDVLTACGRFEDAEAALQKALALNPDMDAAFGALAELYYDQGRTDEAIHALEQAGELNPSAPDYLSNMGAYLLDDGRTNEALAALDRAVTAHPEHVNTRNNRAATLRKLGRVDDAITDVRCALETAPDDGESLANLGLLLEMTGALDEAKDAARRALDVAPDSPHAHSIMGVVLKSLGDFKPAREHLQRALELDPGHVEANWSLALLQLLEGDFENGWWNYRWRWQLEHRPCPYPDRKLWDGGPLNGESILIHAEQGLGDALQFMRYVPEIAALGGRVTFACHAPLQDMLKRTFAQVNDVTIACHDDEAPATDWHAPLLGLPHLFGTELDTIPAPAPTIQRRDAGRCALPVHPKGDKGKLKVGLVWSGNPIQRNNHNRSAPLSALKDMIEGADACFYSLQVGGQDDDMAVLQGLDNMVDLSPLIHDFSDTADLVGQLDLVISVCTSVAHLSGAMGTPTWVMLAHVPDFRWLQDREDSPWYPAARLFRQPEPGDWQAVAARISAALPLFKP